LYHLGSYRAACVYLNRALKADSDYLPARKNLANTLFALAKYSDADLEFTAVLQHSSTDESAWVGRFECCFSQDMVGECNTILHDWPDALKHFKSFYLARARMLRKAGNDIEAIHCLQQAANRHPDAADLYALMCETFIDTYKLDNALTVIKKAVELQPCNLFYRCLEASIYYLRSDVANCAESMSAAFRLCPDSAILLLNQYLLFPVIPTSAKEIQVCRARFLDGLKKAESMPNLRLFTNHPISLHTFTLAYHNKDDRRILERYTRLMKRLADPLLSALDKDWKKQIHLTPALKTYDSRVRIGFLSSYFYGHSNTMAFQGLIRLMNRTKFHLTLIHGHGSKNDRVKEDLNSHVDQVVDLPSDMSQIYSLLHSLQLDILYFTDLGMSPFDFLYPFFRSSPIQITGWGIPHTSGNDHIDFYISAKGVEPAGADMLYTEKLVELPGGLPCCFYTDSLDTPELGREYFFLPRHSKLIGCLQSLHKLHPDFDFMLQAIALDNPDSIFVFVEDSFPESTQIFLNRLSESASAAKEQTIVLSKMAREEYQALCKCMDVLLDPIYYGSGITFFEAVLAGTPIVTLEGDYLRSRVAASGYREMGIYDAPIASSKKDYINLVSLLLENDEKRNSLRQQILSQRHRVFNRADYVRSFEDFCLSATGKSPSNPFQHE
jgi:predicted O-linked N-acetylglucosamine transferase (SPINDLY family)